MRGSPMKGAVAKRNSFGMRPAIDGNPRRSNPSSISGTPDRASLGVVPQGSGSLFDSSNGVKVVDGVGAAHGGDEAAGGGVSRAPASSSAPSLSNAGGSDFVKRGVSPGMGGTAYVVGSVAAAGADDGERKNDEEEDVPRNVSMEESGGTNPLYKAVAPLTTSGSGSQAVS